VYADIAARGRRFKCAAITRMDEAIGQVLDLLNEEKPAENTLVVFCSHNGGGGRGLTAPLRGRMNQLFDGGRRVPFIARWQGLDGAPVYLLDQFLCRRFKRFQNGGGFIKLCAGR
jgi:arylsulfatase A-like enzyme